MTLFDIIIIILELTGLGISLYLFAKNYKEKPPVCMIGHDCGAVLNSKYSRFLGLKMVENTVIINVWFHQFCLKSIILKKKQKPIIIIIFRKYYPYAFFNSFVFVFLYIDTVNFPQKSR